MLLLIFIVCFACASANRYSVRAVSNPDAFALEHSLHHVARVAGFDIFEPKERLISDAHLTALGLHKDKKRQQFKRSRVNDPLYPSQWHLHDNPFAVGVVEGATGKGVNVAIVDDGVQHSHADLRVNYRADLSYDFNGHDNDPAPYSYDSHGTSCSGVCCAAQNNHVCGRGVAPEASIVGIRLIARTTYDYEEAQGLTHRNDVIRIYSSSWGPTDNGMDMVAPGRVTQEALKQGYESGVAIYIWAGGNGRTAQDSSNYDGYANSPYTLAIGAVDHTGHQSWYSESGANLIGVTPSSGAGKGIATVDLKNRCTHRFGGTSSSAPLAAGLVALMLEARPDLRVRDVQHIMAKTASKNVRGGQWSHMNSRGYTHSNGFGFGLLRTRALITEAKNHQLVPHPVRYVQSSTVTLKNMHLPTRVQVKAPNALSFIEQVLVTVRMTHPQRGQVKVRVMSPEATSILAEKRGDSHSGQSTWTYSSLRHWGEELHRADTWTVALDDTRGTVQSVQITWMGY